MRRVFALLSFVALVAVGLGISNSAYAASSISVVGTPALGSTVSFQTSFPKQTKNPAVEIDCYQNGQLVWGTIGATTDSYLLGAASSPWLTNGGSATCTASLESIVWKAGVESKTVLASTGFTA